MRKHTGLSRALLPGIGLLLMVAALTPSGWVRGEGPTRFKRIPLPYIAALGAPSASAGSGVQGKGGGSGVLIQARVE